MKRLITIIVFMVIALSALAQTPQEIVSRMEDVMNANESRGIIMLVDIKMPLIGTITSKIYTLGDKTYTKGGMLGQRAYTWTDPETTYVYYPDNNEIVIEDTEEDTDTETQMFDSISDGYDLVLTSENQRAWHIRGRKKKDNKEKDAPKKLEIVISKADYRPLSLTAKDTFMTMTLHGVSFGVNPEKVTFDMKKHAGAKVTDQRKK